ncbi:MAG: DUF721 domain-containing protein [Candidatus Gracilibacteria bacterium]|jgi:predicted nucleic acid-binding Zn ribbon protein
MFHTLRELLPRAISKFGVGTEVKAAQICYDFKQLVPKIFTHEDASTCILPMYYKNKTLTVSADSSSWAQEISMRKSEIIRELNAKAGEKAIEDLFIRLKTLER